MSPATLDTLKRWYGAAPFAYKRRKTRVVPVGKVLVGGDQPLRLQSMCTTDTMDTDATVAQSLRMVEAGCEIVRITAQTKRHAANLAAIKQKLREAGCDAPLVADIHFQPEAAMEAALHVEKVRVNPGNYADTKHFNIREYSDSQYADELMRIEERFAPLVARAKERKVALRVGTNHGSLSDRIMNRYGDSPAGMVESAMEFVRICAKMDFHDIILSMKSSQPRVMIQAYRMLAAAMNAEGMDYPFHLGVTEAGDGEDGRIKSAVGIGALLEDGIGDTIRVSLTEDPEAEIPVAAALAARYPGKAERSKVLASGFDSLAESWIKEHPYLEFPRLDNGECKLDSFNLHQNSLVRVISPVPGPVSDWEGNIKELRRLHQKAGDSPVRPEFSLMDLSSEAELQGANRYAEVARSMNVPSVARFGLEVGLEKGAGFDGAMVGLRVPFEPETGALQKFGPLAEALKAKGSALMLEFEQGPGETFMGTVKAWVEAAEKHGPEDLLLAVSGGGVTELLHLNRGLAAWQLGRPRRHPLALAYAGDENAEMLRLSASVLFGAMLCDGVGDAVLLESKPEGFDPLVFCFNVLQGAGVRASKTEFIACPSCGRTLFDLQDVTARIRERTGHLQGVKIAIMGCIVNGPGEMADADFGYVGGAPGKINLYVGKDCVEKGIPFDQADDRLIELIKRHDRWRDPKK